MRLHVLLLSLSVVSCSGTAHDSEHGNATDRSDPAALPTHGEALRRDELEPRVMLEAPGHGPVPVRVEVASTNATRQRGLMFRRRLDPDAGMLFIFDQPEQLSFWMHNTYLPLDMIFIDADRRVLGVVENAEPLTDDPREVQGLSLYVLEVNAGFSRRHGIGPGTLVRFEGVSEDAERRGGM